MKPCINLIGQEVAHTIYGKGIVVEQGSDTIKVEFFEPPEMQKKFCKFSLASVDTFRRFLKCHDPNIQRYMLLRDFHDLPFVEYGGVEWWRKGARQWLNIDFSYAKSELLISKLEKLHEEETRREKLQALRDCTVPELLVKASALRAEIKDAQSGRSGNDTNGIVKAKAFEGIQCIEAALVDPEKITVAEIRGCLPMLSAFYRNIGEPAKCYTNIFLKYKDSNALSGMFYISLAAAYCDMSDVDGALDALDMAYSLGESPDGVHAQRVYQRIQALLRERDSCDV